MVHRLVREVCAPPTLDRAFDPPARRHVCRPFPPAVIDFERPDPVRIVAVAVRNMRPAKKARWGQRAPPWIEALGQRAPPWIEALV